MRHQPLVPTLLAVTAATALLAGCGGTSAAPAATSSSPAATSSGPAADDPADEAGLVLRDGWVKATDGGMTGVFGALVNHTGAEVRLVGASSEVAAMTELHVTVDDGAGGRVMREAEDGFTLPAGSTHELAPGGDHIMLMDLTERVVNGEELTLTLLTEDGSSFEVEVVARAFVGAEETYAPGDGMPDDTDDTGTAP